MLLLTKAVFLLHCICRFPEIPFLLHAGYILYGKGLLQNSVVSYNFENEVLGQVLCAG